MGLKIQAVETVCGLSNCSYSFDNQIQYLKHLKEHDRKVQESYLRIKKILENNPDHPKTNSEDFVCGSCSNNIEKSIACLEDHKTECLERIQKVRKTVFSSGKKLTHQVGMISNDLKPDNSIKIGDKSTNSCDDCISQPNGKSVCSREFVVSLSRLNHDTVLEFLENNNWQNCPYCLKTLQREDLPYHFINGHPEVSDIVEVLTEPAEECGDCLTKISDPEDLIQHKYLHCPQDQSKERNLRQLFGNLKLEEFYHKKEDRILVSEFQTRSMKNEELIKTVVEKFLQEKEKVIEKETKFNEITRRTRRRSGNVQTEQPNCRTREENIEKMKSDLYCAQCHLTFKDPAEAADEKKSKHHFCYTVGNLRTPLKLDTDPTPSPTKKVTLNCTICPNLRTIVFANYEELKKHIVLAHKANFFREEIIKNKKKKGLPVEDRSCVIRDCTFRSETLEDALIHLGVFHEKLFYALQHDKKNNWQFIASKLFPEKFKNSNHEWTRGSGGSKPNARNSNMKLDPQQSASSNVKDAKRVLDMEQVVGPSKKTKSEVDSPVNVETQKSDTFVNDEQSLPNLSALSSQNKPETEKVKTSQSKPGGGGKPRVMKSMECEVCGATLSNKSTYRRHLAGEHFAQQILASYPSTASKEGHYPCGFPECDETFKTELVRIQHLGLQHGQVQRCLSTPKIMAEARAKELKRKDKKKPEARKRRASTDLKCKTCNQEFPTAEARSLHTCHSILDKPPAELRRNSVGTLSVDEEDNVRPDSSRKNKRKKRLVIKDPKDIRDGLSDASEDSSELNEIVGETQENDYDQWKGQRCEDKDCKRPDCAPCEYCNLQKHSDHAHFTCESTTCDRCFPTAELRDEHFSSCHTFQDLH